MRKWTRIANEVDDTGRPFHRAGEQVIAGIYREIETRKEVRLETEDTLPASLDGRVACYVRVQNFGDDKQA